MNPLYTQQTEGHISQMENRIHELQGQIGGGYPGGPGAGQNQSFSPGHPQVHPYGGGHTGGQNLFHPGGFPRQGYGQNPYSQGGVPQAGLQQGYGQAAVSQGGFQQCPECCQGC